MRLLSAIAALTTCALPAALAAQESVAHSIYLAERIIQVRDLARLAPEAEHRFGSLPVAQIPDGHSALELSAERRAALLRRRVPSYLFPLRVEGPVRFAAPHAETMGRTGRACFALRQNLAAGDYVIGDTIAAAPCRATLSASLPLRFDPAAGAARADAPLNAGTYLGPLALREGGLVKQGHNLTLAIHAGPVRIERRVSAMQPARSGHALFVRTAEGAILTAPLATLRQEGANR